MPVGGVHSVVPGAASLSASWTNETSTTASWPPDCAGVVIDVAPVEVTETCDGVATGSPVVPRITTPAMVGGRVAVPPVVNDNVVPLIAAVTGTL